MGMFDFLKGTGRMEKQSGKVELLDFYRSGVEGRLETNNPMLKNSERVSVKVRDGGLNLFLGNGEAVVTSRIRGITELKWPAPGFEFHTGQDHYYRVFPYRAG